MCSALTVKQPHQCCSQSRCPSHTHTIHKHIASGFVHWVVHSVLACGQPFTAPVQLTQQLHWWFTGDALVVPWWFPGDHWWFTGEVLCKPFVSPVQHTQPLFIS